VALGRVIILGGVQRAPTSRELHEQQWREAEEARRQADTPVDLRITLPDRPGSPRVVRGSAIFGDLGASALLSVLPDEARVDGGSRLKLRGRGFPTGAAAASLEASARFSWYAAAEDDESGGGGEKGEKEKGKEKEKEKEKTRKRVLHAMEVRRHALCTCAERRPRVTLPRPGPQVPATLVSPFLAECDSPNVLLVRRRQPNRERDAPELS
jgi:hypothetical protein